MFDLHLLSPAFGALFQVILIDIAMAGDNAIVIGLAANRVPKPDRPKVIFGGLVAAVILRILLALLTVRLLKINIFLTLAGGILLLWVAWRLYREIRHSQDEKICAKAIASAISDCASEARPPSDLRRAILQIAAADISMSLDNVLAVAGAARSAGSAINRLWVLTAGLMLSIALMGFAASLVAKLLQRYPWINYAGLAIVVYVALKMIWDGSLAILHAG